MATEIHALMQNAHHLDAAGSGNSVEQDVGVHREPAIPLSDLITRPPPSRIAGDRLDSSADVFDVVLSLVSFQRSAV
jgi:hypothetical protein